MNIKKFEQLLQKFAEAEPARSPASLEAGWQRLAERLDKKAGKPLASPCQPLGDRPGPHGCLGLEGRQYDFRRLRLVNEAQNQAVRQG